MRALVLFVLTVPLVACGTIGGIPDADAPLPSSIEEIVYRTYPGQRVVFCETRPSPAGGPVHRVTLDRLGLRTWVLFDDQGQ